MILKSTILNNTSEQYFASNTEVNLFYKNAKQKGGQPSQEEISLLDTFISTLKKNGIRSKIEELTVFCGGFNSCFSKLIYNTRAGAYIENRGFKAQDYNPNLGLTGNGIDKYLLSYFSCANTPITNRNISFGIYSTSSNCVNLGIPIGNTTTVGGSGNGYYLAYSSANGQPSSGVVGFTQPAQITTKGLNCISSGTTGQGGCRSYVCGQVKDIRAQANTNVPTGNLNIFGWSNSFFYSGSISAYYVSQYLSASEILILSNAFDTLNYGLKRNQSNNRNLFFGDSITFGTKNSLNALEGYYTSQRWSTIVNSSIGGIELNSGIAGTVVQNTTPTLTANGRDRYSSDILNYAPDTVWCIYGLNDGRYNGASFSVSAYETQLGEIIQGVIDSGVQAQKIRLGSPYYNNPAFYSSYIPFNALTVTKQEQYRDATANVAVSKGTKYKDIYQDMLDNGANSLLSSDGVHLSVSGNAYVAQQMLLAT